MSVAERNVLSLVSVYYVHKSVHAQIWKCLQATDESLEYSKYMKLPNIAVRLREVGKYANMLNNIVKLQF